MIQRAVNLVAPNADETLYKRHMGSALMAIGVSA